MAGPRRASVAPRAPAPGRRRRRRRMLVVEAEKKEAAEEEKLYEELAKKFIEELGLSRDDLPEHWKKTHLEDEGADGVESMQ